MIISMIDLEVQRQAAMIAYLDTFWITMWAAVLALPLIFFLIAAFFAWLDRSPSRG